jgi:thioredoxin-like negative regulator of GroEL
MRITTTRLVLALAIALAIQGAVFAWRYNDLLYLRQPVPAITGGDAATFRSHAAEALARPRVTREHLDTIAEAADALGSVDLEIRALERQAQLEPSNTKLKLHLADVLQKVGQSQRAEALYREILMNGKGDSR